MKTSLPEIKSFYPCTSGWKDILEARKGKDYDAEFPVVECVDSNSISDVCWLLGKKKQATVLVVFAHKCADSVKHLSNRYAYYAAYAAADAAAAAYAAADADAAADAVAAAYAAAAADADAAADAADASAAAYAANAYAAADAADASAAAYAAACAHAAAAYAAACAYAAAARQTKILECKQFLRDAIDEV